MYLCLVCTTEYRSNNVEENVGRSTSDTAIAATTSSISVFVLIGATALLIILLRYWSLHRRISGK